MLEEILREIEAMEYPFPAVEEAYPAASIGFETAKNMITGIIRRHMEDDGWIYCGDGKNMPKEDGSYMCTIYDGHHSYLLEAYYDTDLLDGWPFEDVIAYYPKPFIPYRPKQKAVGEDYKQQIMERFLKVE